MRKHQVKSMSSVKFLSFPMCTSACKLVSFNCMWMILSFVFNSMLITFVSEPLGPFYLNLAGSSMWCSCYTTTTCITNLCTDTYLSWHLHTSHDSLHLFFSTSSPHDCLSCSCICNCSNMLLFLPSFLVILLHFIWFS